MSEVFKTVWLVQRGEDMGWKTYRATFSPRSILAHVQLSAVKMVNGESFQPGRPQYAVSYIQIKPESAWSLTGPTNNQETDNFVWMEAAREVTFVLTAQGIVSCSALGLIHDRGSQMTLSSVVKTAHLAVFDDEGIVVGRHTEEQLEGGEKFDLEDIQEQVLRRATAWTDRDVDVTPVDLTGIPPNAEFRINTRTRRPVPPRDPGRT